ncbi:CatB-related O-acetyltransferase [Polaribacter sp.]|uniref:CatB-related O-acetyltransferase n=1 Tax=Polaribacter sp. TaxID=1920175 RepID=UPI0035C81204
MIRKFLNFLKYRLYRKKTIDKKVLRFMSNNPSYKKYDVGKGTYGFPEIFDWNDDSKLLIGKYCSIGDNVSILLGGEHYSNFISTYPFHSFNNSFIAKDRKTKGNVVIGNDVWICNGVTILSGVTIGHGAIIGAGSVVTKNVADYNIVAGNPARVIRKRFTDKQIEKLIKISWWNWEDEKIKNNLEQLSSLELDNFLETYEL